MKKQKNLASAISVLGKIFIILAVFLALTARDHFDEYRTIKAPVADLSKKERIKPTSDGPIDQKVSFITARNLLGHTEAAPRPTEAPQKKSDLKLRLVGTTLASGLDPIAIIEDMSSKKQDAFSPGESLFDKATLKEVSVDKIRVERDGKIEIIEVTEGQSSPGDPNESNIRSDGGNFVVPEEEVNAALSNLPVLLSQARAVPYFRNGQSVGMRLYAIRSGSLYEKLGLKNSDIIKQINNNAVNDPSKALKLFEDLKTQRSISVGVEREGQDLQLNYQIR